MEVMYLLIAFSLIIASGFLGAFIWAVRNGQFDDRDTPSMRMLVDDVVPRKKRKKKTGRRVDGHSADAEGAGATPTDPLPPNALPTDALSPDVLSPDALPPNPLPPNPLPPDARIAESAGAAENPAQSAKPIHPKEPNPVPDSALEEKRGIAGKPIHPKNVSQTRKVSTTGKADPDSTQQELF